MSSLNEWGDNLFPNDCDSFTLGAIPADQNCLVNPQLSQISDLYIQPEGALAPFAWTGFTASINEDGVGNNVTNNSRSKWLTGKGGIPAPSETIYQGFKFKKVVAERAYQLTFRTEVRDGYQRDFLRQLQSNWIEFVFWVGTLGKNLFGGPNGIKPYYSSAILPLDPGDQDFEKGIITIEFLTKNGAVPRTINPLAGITPSPALQSVVGDDDGNVLVDSEGNTVSFF